MQGKTVGIWAIAAFALLCCFPLFLHLTNFPVRTWDESRLAESAYEMAHGGNWIAVPYEGTPDMWSTKPPLMIWLQALCIKIFGYRELAVRLPSSVASFLTCVVMFLFCYRYLKRPEMGFLAALVLVSTTGYVMRHLARTGDYDALLTMLSTVMLLCFYISLDSEDEAISQRFLLYFFIALTLGVLDKGIQVLFFMPAVVVFAFARGKVLFILKQRNFYLGVAMFMVFGFGYYLLREKINHGYIKAVWENELGGRFGQIIEGHSGPFTYYWDYLINEGYSAWYLLVPCAIFIGLFQKDKRLKIFTWFLALVIIEYLLVISSAQTKLSWYTAPLYPLMALLVGVLLSWLYNVISGLETLNVGLKYRVAAFVPLFLIFIKPYSEVIGNSWTFKEMYWATWMDKIPNYLRHVINDHGNVDGAKIIYNEHPSNIKFYQRMLSDRGQNVPMSSFNELNDGDRIIICQDDLLREIQGKFNTRMVDSLGGGMLFYISKK